jgi:hypothetical protein
VSTPVWQNTISPLFRHLLELDLDFRNTAEALWCFKGEGQRMRLVDSGVVSEVVNRRNR